MNRITLSLAVVVTGLIVPSAQADFIYADFSSTVGLQLNGNASAVGSVLRLTPAASSQGGSAFTTALTALGGLNSFSTYFQFRISNSGGIGDGDGPGADGLVFVIQTVNNNVGGVGGGIGYLGITPSLGIEFDTFNNGPGAGDPNGNHVSIDQNGSLTPTTTTIEPVRFNNGNIWNAWVDYDGTTDALEVRWSQVALRPLAAQLSSTIDLVALLGQSTAYLGFTAGTGAGWGDQDILNWEYHDSFSPIAGAVPEPATITMLAIGCASLAGYRLRRRKEAIA